MNKFRLIKWGLAPHAPYSVSSSLFREVKRLANRYKFPLSCHVAEFYEELQLLKDGSGNMKSLLVELGMYDDKWIPPAESPVRYLDSLGVLDSLVAVHLNLAEGDLDILKSRKVLVENIEILSWNNPKIKVRIKCGSGFYVRSFANDLGLSLKVPSVLSSLERVQYGQFKIINSMNINEFSNDFIDELIPINKILNHLPKFIMNKKLENEFYQGKVFSSENLSLNLLNNEDIKIYNLNHKFIGLLTFDDSKNFWKPKNIIR